MSLVAIKKFRTWTEQDDDDVMEWVNSRNDGILKKLHMNTRVPNNLTTRHSAFECKKRWNNVLYPIAKKQEEEEDEEEETDEEQEEEKKHWTEDDDSNLTHALTIYRFARTYRKLPGNVSLPQFTHDECLERWNNVLYPRYLEQTRKVTVESPPKVTKVPRRIDILPPRQVVVESPQKVTVVPTEDTKIAVHEANQEFYFDQLEKLQNSFNDDV